jgi:hypothetical protein
MLGSRCKDRQARLPDAPPWPAFSVGSDIWMEVGEPVTPQPVSATPILNFLQSRLEK